MKNKHVFFGVLFLLFGVSVNAQTLTPTAISSGGGFFSSASGSLSGTVAEMTMVQTFIGTNNILTQGFQQPEDYSISIAENEASSGEMMIYPNPTNGQFSLLFNNDGAQQHSLKIYNLVGQVVLTKKLESVQGLNTCRFDISQQGQGIYMLEFTSIDSKGKEKVTVLKINLIY